MQRSRRATGFTMIEMIVTMTIFAILVAIGVPTMSTWIRNNKVRTVADALQTGLRAAQAESLRRSRQVVFSLTDSTTPTAIPLPASVTGKSWAIWTVPSMAGETPAFVQSGILSNASTAVQVVTTASTVCFNSMGRLVNNAGANVVAITGGDDCVQPTTAVPGTPAVQTFTISIPGGDRPLQVNLGLGGQVHMCDPGVPISDSHPEGCP
ncbi:MAG TPA: GspH/FimT family pseudopilin [Steroidobacteraceae bacterium]|nr:GspH/FimT family pseudopilin [Steroidobacteraceae bacterium]